MFPTCEKWRTLYLLNGASGLLAGFVTVIQTSDWYFAWYETGIYFTLQWMMVFVGCLIAFEFTEHLGRL
jgi:hypothetical protein